VPLRRKKSAPSNSALVEDAYACSPLTGEATPRGARPEGAPFRASFGDASPIST